MLKLTIGCISGARSIAPMITELELMKRPKVAIIVARISSIVNVLFSRLSSLRFEKSAAYCSWLAWLKKGIVFAR